MIAAAPGGAGRAPRLRSGTAFRFFGREKEWYEIRLAPGTSWEMDTIDKHLARQGVHQGAMTIRPWAGEVIRVNVFRTGSKDLGSFYGQEAKEPKAPRVQDPRKPEHHLAAYNDKLVEVVQDNPRDEFRLACMRVRDNANAGYVLTPKGELFALSRA